MKSIIHITSIMVLGCLFSCQSTQKATGQHPSAQASSLNTFSTHSGIACDVELPYNNEVKSQIEGNTRIISANGIPDHVVGAFPNRNNPNSIKPQHHVYKIPLYPQKAEKMTSLYTGEGMGIGMPAYFFGVALNGVKMDPPALEAFVNPKTQEMNVDWAKEALSSSVKLGEDCNNAHVQPNGEYHYHGTPTGIVNQASGSSMFQVGWAADGFPIYYKWGYQDSNNPESDLIELKSSYVLRSGQRPGNGKKAPAGTYDGTYTRDFEYVAGKGDLDEANGRFGVTPEFPEGTYYYVITDDFPSIPRMLVGTPSNDFKLGGRMAGGQMRHPSQRAGQGQRPDGPPNGERPDPARILSDLDRNGDNRISKEEARGPLQQGFDRVDQNGDGFITKEELEKMRPPRRP
ncbi:MAG: YHYH protein [Bacteroidota bacterium]